MKLSLPFQVLAGLLLAILVVFVGVKTWNAIAEHDRIGVAVRDRDTFTVAGEGKVTSSPDVVIVSLGVQTDAATVRAGQTDNTKKMNDINAMLKQQGVEEKDITTQNYSIYPRYNYENGKQDIIGYTVSQNLSVKIRDLDKTGDILSRAGDLGANQVGGINFTIDDPTGLQAQARGKAIDDAKQKADQLAQQLGLHIVKVVSFSESSGGYPAPYPMLYAKDMAAGIGGAESAPDIQPGSQEVISNVNVVFEVR
jgi:uncharacterized protein YggE